MLFISPALAGHTDAVSNAALINTILDSRTPYDVTFTESQMALAGYDTTNMSRPGTYRLYIKDVDYNPSTGEAILYLNAWWNSNSIGVNNPVRIYLPSSGAIPGSTTTTRLRSLAFLLISYLDTKALGEPINDDTLLVYPTADGYVSDTDSGATYATLRSNPGDGGSNSGTVGYVYIRSTTGDGTFYQMQRGALIFNTSAVGSSSTITSAKVGLTGAAKANGLGSPGYGMTLFTPDTPGTLTVGGDYDSWSSLRIASDIPYASLPTTNTYCNWSITNLSAISKTGYTNIMIRDEWDIDYAGSFGGNSSTIGITSWTFITDEHATYNPPFMEIIYTPSAGGDTTPPSSITGLTNTSVSCSQLFFNWTNPGDSDFGGIMVWQNNTALTNLTNTTTGVSWTGLPESTAITFSSKTFDLAGNVNSSFVNMTRNTDACGVAPVAAFSANNTSVCINDWVQFTDESTNVPTGWHWIIAGGWDSHDQNPVHQFDAEGLYTVNLTVLNDYGNDTESKLNYINVSNCSVPPTPTPTPTPTVAPTAAPLTDWPWCADQDIFFWNASSDISGYRTMAHVPEIDSQRSITSASFDSGSGEITIGTWITPSGHPGVSTIGPGLFRFRTYAYASSSSGVTSLKFYIINRSADGTETNLFYGNAITRDIDKTTVPSEYLTSYARRNYTSLFPGDRLVIRVNATTDSVSARTVTMEVAGNTNASMVGVSYFLCDSILAESSGGGEGSKTGGSPIGADLVVVPFLVIPLLCMFYVFRWDGYGGTNTVWADLIATGFGAAISAAVMVWFIIGGITSVPVTVESSAFSVPSGMSVSDAISNASVLPSLGNLGSGMYVVSSMSSAVTTDLGVSIHTHDSVIIQYQDFGVALLYGMFTAILVALFAWTLHQSWNQILGERDAENDPERWRS